MYEDKTVDNIQTNLLDNISDDYEKSIGTLVYDLTKSFAIEENQVYQALDELINKVDVDKLTGDDLEKYVYQRKGIERKSATKAIGTLTVTGTGTIEEGDLFETSSGTQFIAIETVAIDTSGTVNIEAVEAGTSGNVGANTITLMPVTIAGITSVTNDEATYNGFDAESDVDLRDRYYEELRKPPTSGNKYHYTSWAKEIDGVGDAKVFPLWNGDNTVKVVIIDSNKEPASSELITDVQEYIDPNTSGIGEGVAPIGAYCTVTSATGIDINLEIALTKSTNYTDSEVITNISNKVTEYLQSIAFNQDYVSYAKIGSLVLESEGVEDYTTLNVNGGTTSINVGDEEVAVLGTVTLL